MKKFQLHRMQKGLSVVIPNYNGLHLFADTLPTVFAALAQLDLPSEIIVVDDCSTDASIEFLRKNYPTINLLRNEKNRGFSVTANKGVNAAAYDLVLLLNSDVKLEADYFKGQLQFFEREDTFGVMGCIRGWDDEKVQDGAKYPYFHGVKIKTSGNYLLENDAEMSGGLYSMYLSGANALIAKEKFLQLGGFNELFSPFYVEDFELSLRAWRMGWKCYFHYPSVCRHKTSTTISSTRKSSFVDVIYNRNKFYLHAIHLDQAKRLLWMLQLIPESIMKLFLLKWDYFRSVFLFISTYQKVVNSRNTLFKQAGNQKLLSLNEVVNQVRESINNKTIIRF
ncbi:MAG: glycosyltransferase family 2 protein [Chitinophagaceae bacterium]|nr:MAG: glycosyltransferase family 2 protein [Chitinophagaceae bacterium]